MLTAKRWLARAEGGSPAHPLRGGGIEPTPNVAEAAEREVCGVRRWALDVQRRSNHNKAACAPANKLARICYATLRDGTPFGETERLNRKLGGPFWQTASLLQKFQIQTLEADHCQGTVNVFRDGFCLLNGFLELGELNELVLIGVGGDGFSEGCVWLFLK